MCDTCKTAKVRLETWRNDEAERIEREESKPRVDALREADVLMLTTAISIVMDRLKRPEVVLMACSEIVAHEFVERLGGVDVIKQMVERNGAVGLQINEDGSVEPVSAAELDKAKADAAQLAGWRGREIPEC